jgi:hypothetical protein
MIAGCGCSATLPANCTLTAADAGVHSFSNLILRKRGRRPSA